MKKEAVLVIILLFFSAYPIIPSVADPEGSDWVIDGDTAYVDNSDVYLSATPHTLGSSGWVNFELESKTHSGSIDCVLGFNSDVAKPAKAEIWRNYSHMLTGYHYEDRYFYNTFFDCVDYTVLDIEDYDLYDVDFGNKNNTKLWNLTYEINHTVIIAFTEKTVDGTTITFKSLEAKYVPYTYEKSFFDWKNLDKEWVKDTYLYEGFDRWYTLEDVTIQEDKLYSMRIWVNIPFKGLQGSTGKYWWSIKPHGKSVEQAVNDNQFYCLDPWWNSSWSYNRTITIESDFLDNSIQDFPLLVVINKTIGDKCDGGDSIRFLNYDNTTEFNYEIEGNWSSTGNSYVWVNISEQIPHDSDYVFVMYYNNSLASSNSSKVGVWDSNYTAVYHMNASNVGDNLDSSLYGNDIASVNNTPTRVAGKIGYGIDFDGNGEYLNVTSSPSLYLEKADGFTLETWVSSSDTEAASKYIMSKADDSSSREWIWKRNPSGKNLATSIYDEDTNKYITVTHGGSTTSDGNFHYIASTWNGTTEAGNIRQFDNGTNLTHVIGVAKSGTFNNIWNTGSKLTIGNSLWDKVPMIGVLDEVRISNVVRNDTWIKASCYSMNQTPGFLTFGYETEAGDISPPSSFTATTISAEKINLTWNRGDRSDKTYIRYSTSGFPSSITDGTLLCNTTGEGWDHTGLDGLTTYYYSAWGYNLVENDYSNNSVTASATTLDKNPAVPYGITAILVSPTRIDFKWSKGSRADTTILVKKSDSYPTDYNDGTTMYDGELTYYNDTSVSTNSYYSLFSYNTTYNTYSSGVNLVWGGLQVNAYHFNTSTNSSSDIRFDLFVTNRSGSETYISYWNTNPETVGVSDIPMGDDVGIRVSSNLTWNVTGGGNNTVYRDRWFYQDITPNILHVVNAYLPLVNDTELYLFTVTDSTGQPVPTAKVSFRQIIEGELKEVSSLLTDGGGQVEIYLEPNLFYKIVITKDGYVTSYNDYTPSDLIFTHAFQIGSISPDVKPDVVYSDIVTFEGFISGTTLTVNFSDVSGDTVDTSIYVYSYNYTTGVTTLLGSDSRSSQSFSYSVNNIDNSNLHKVVLHHNHSDLGYNIQSLIFEMSFNPKIDIDDIFNLNYKGNPFGWSNFFMWILMIAVFFMFGQQGAGISLMFFGVLNMFLNVVIGFTSALSVVAGGVLPMLFIVVGVMVMIRNSGREAR